MASSNHPIVSYSTELTYRIRMGATDDEAARRIAAVIQSRQIESAGRAVVGPVLVDAPSFVVKRDDVVVAKGPKKVSRVSAVLDKAGLTIALAFVLFMLMPNKDDWAFGLVGAYLLVDFGRDVLRNELARWS